MYLFDNPVLQRELLSNLRMSRAFVLLFAYIALLGAIVYFAWPQEQRIDMVQSATGRQLVNLFFLGQYILASMMAPSFAAGTITGEKERKGYEMLIASPLRPGAIVLGKVFASLTPIAILMICSLPIVMLCLPLGGVSPYEVFAAYFAMICAVALFGMISLWASSFFTRTAAALVVSYMMILPLAMLGVLVWIQLSQLGGARLLVVTTVVPLACFSISTLLWADTCRRLISPNDLGSEGKEVVDLDAEASEAVGLYIKRDEFPDRLFAPPKRTTLMEDSINPIYDKEMRSEIFSQGTLMLRLVIQISMLLALPIMAYCLYIERSLAGWYIAYVLLFNMLVGPVFSAGSVTSERERQTLDMLLTTLVTPWQMLWGKLLSGLRISSVLTSFLLWPVLLACLMPMMFWGNLPTMFGYFLIVALSCLTTAMTALFCSTVFQKTATSLICTYLIIAITYTGPVAASLFSDLVFNDSKRSMAVDSLGVLSPFSAVFALPLDVKNDRSQPSSPARLGVFFGYIGWSLLINGILLSLMIWLFKVRWRVSQ